MKRAMLACLAAIALALLSAQAAMAGGTIQETGQSAGNEQHAASGALSVQEGATNQNISVRIMSPGDNGPVSQTNSSSATSAAGNHNATGQTANQAAGGPAQQAVGQAAGNAQSALSGAVSKQIAPKNENVDVRIMSPGSNGPVTQTNSSSASSAAGNHNTTGQAATQAAGGGGGGGQQAIGQDAWSGQHAGSLGASVQAEPANAGGGGGGGGGATSQANTSDGSSAAGNHNGTGQSATQGLGGGGGSAVQAIGQDAGNAQSAKSLALSFQVGARNHNSGSGGGAVTQTNSSSADSVAGNKNTTGQAATQNAGGGHPWPESHSCTSCDHGGPVVQAIGQRAHSEQAAKSIALAKQLCPENVNTGTHDLPGGHGHEPNVVAVPGAVEQKNGSYATSASGNKNDAGQTATQAAGIAAMFA